MVEIFMVEVNERLEVCLNMFLVLSSKNYIDQDYRKEYYNIFLFQYFPSCLIDPCNILKLICVQFNASSFFFSSSFSLSSSYFFSFLLFNVSSFFSYSGFPIISFSFPPLEFLFSALYSSFCPFSSLHSILCSLYSLRSLSSLTTVEVMP